MMPETLRSLLAELAELPDRDEDPLEVDSLTLVQITEAIEERFDFVVHARDLVPENFGSVAAIAAFLRGRGK